MSEQWGKPGVSPEFYEERRDADGKLTSFNVSGEYRQCRSCRAPIVQPFPPDWSVSMFTLGRGHRPLIVPHRPDCTDQSGYIGDGNDWPIGPVS